LISSYLARRVLCVLFGTFWRSHWAELGAFSWDLRLQIKIALSFRSHPLSRLSSVRRSGADSGIVAPVSLIDKPPNADFPLSSSGQPNGAVTCGYHTFPRSWRQQAKLASEFWHMYMSALALNCACQLDPQVITS
jgi:hypothetical protein